MKLAVFLAAISLAAQTPETITIDATAPTHPFPHFWEQVFGSGRASLSLRDPYRQDLRAARDAIGFQYIRFHAILDDERRPDLRRYKPLPSPTKTPR